MQFYSVYCLFNEIWHFSCIYCKIILNFIGISLLCQTQFSGIQNILFAYFVFKCLYAAKDSCILYVALYVALFSELHTENFLIYFIFKSLFHNTIFWYVTSFVFVKIFKRYSILFIDWGFKNKTFYIIT